MTTVRYDREHLEMTVSGHSGAGEAGRDIVCAGISTLAQTLAWHAQDRPEFNAELYIDMKAPLLKISCTPRVEHVERCRDMFDVIFTGFQMMTSSYPDNVRIGGTDGN